MRPPASSSSDIVRERLLARLDQARAITVICGPAGSGKTSLLATWAAAHADPAPIAWLGLDHHDDDPTALWEGIIAALRTTGLFVQTAALHDVRPPRTVEAGFVDAVMDQVALLPGRLWLVLDDVHTLSQQDTLESLRSLAMRLPENLHLVLSGRAEPELDLPRLVLTGKLTRMLADDLAFTVEEASELLARQSLGVPDDVVRRLHRQTEGWAAGLRIAALVLASGARQDALVRGLMGDDYAVADYLTTQVLTTLTPEQRDFLLRTSTCTQLNVDLARHLSGREDAAVLLDELLQRGAFTMRQGRERRNYRYHDLFRSYLTAERRRRQPQLDCALQEATAEWYLDRGDPLHAMEHLVLAGRTDRLEQVATRHGVATILDGRGHRLVTLLEKLDTAGRARPMLALLGAAAALELEQVDRADRWLLEVDMSAALASADQVCATLAATIALARARYDDRVADELAQLESTWSGVEEDDDLALLARHQRGVARLYVGRYEDAIDDLEQVGRAAHLTGRDALRLSCLSFIAGTEASMSRLPGMRRHAEEALELAARRGWTGSRATAHAYMLAAWSAYLRADHATASRNAAAATLALGRHADPDVELATRTVALFVAADEEDPFEALVEYRAAFQRLAHAQMSPALLASAAPELVRIGLDLGEPAWALSVLDVSTAAEVDPGERALLRAMLLHGDGRTDAALRELQSVITGRASCHVVTSTVRALLFAAVLEWHHGKSIVARAHLESALSLAEPLDLVRPFLDDAPLRDLIVSGQGRYGRQEGFVRRIQAAAAEHPASAVRRVARLSAREVVVLRELPSRLSISEIAEARGVSVNTIKTQVRAIYRKLEVSSRREAVEAARSQGLL